MAQLAFRVGTIEASGRPTGLGDDVRTDVAFTPQVRS
jgi:hypothetical protein